MELVYLWIEKYKNIEKQEFNFSPKFKCNYDGETLTIEENEDYVHIFPKNISVTAIVGENGSGKSSILKYNVQYISMLLNNKIDLIALSSNIYFFIFFDKSSDNIYIIGSVFEDIKILNNSSKNVFSNKIESFKSKKYISLLKNKNYDEITNIEHFEKYNNINENIYKKNYTNLIKESFFLYYDYSFDFFMNYHSETNFLSVPNKEYDIYQHHNYDKTLLIEHIIHKKYIQKDKKYFEPNKIVIEPLKNLASIFHHRNTLDMYHFIIFLINSSIFELLKNQNRNFINKNVINNPKLLNELILNNLKSIKNTINSQAKEIPLAYQLNDLLIFLNIIDKHRHIIEKIFYFNDSLANIHVNIKYINKDNIELLTKIPTDFLKLKIYSNNYDYDDLSNGEKSALRIRFYIERVIKNSKRKNYFILLDEAENELHPQWQKMIIKYLLDIFEEKEETFHFILTSHSPFIISDIPKENVIFLEKGNQVHPNINQTFGANIHTLLSHGFFIKDGLMGEFAKEKINDVIKLLKDDKKELSQDEIKFCKKIVSIIGEPILQRTLQSQLDIKLYPKESELEKLEREQKELQEKIDELKKKKNETD